ncbi:hypothetical protein [Sphaerisporangium sp. TRM90804]|uniref:hypothetical protein n=1 Tax=Sphaerisporangium sp. TRM90804 TaxID=3031113 RepID=UPI0024480A6E|nr:hypothetical protein [Sphaerisporangium sp. TRM90804]MDH2424135.1 hypothetical protein [Sphaerisporangium sp. TRM90804]
MQYAIVALTGMVLVLLVLVSFDRHTVRRVMPVVLAAFTVRLAVHAMLMRNPLVTVGIGDSVYYERAALAVVDLWRREGLHFVTADQVQSLHSVAVPCNLFALVIYLCDGPASLACTAVVAAVSCALGVVMYKFGRLVGADARACLFLLGLTVFTPAFLAHTSDMFKDGFNAFLVVTSLWVGARNMRRFDPRNLVALAPLLWGLWHVRPYMVFMCALPLVVGVSGLKRLISPRALLLFAVIAFGLLQGGLTESAPFETMRRQLEYGQAESVLRSNAAGGSGVEFDDGGNAWDHLGTKLLYTVLSPFPWTDGSLLLQLGKIEALIWYFLLFGAVRGVRRLWARDRRIVMFLLLFIVPGTVVYATTMSNVGLIMRQRMPIVMVTSLLAAVAWSRRPGDGSAGVPAQPGAPEGEVLASRAGLGGFPAGGLPAWGGALPAGAGPRVGPAAPRPRA